MACLTQRVIRQGIKPCEMNVLMPAAKAINGAGIIRSMSTSIFSRATGSVLGNYSAKVKRGDVMQALDQIQRRERLMRLDEMMARHAFYEKGFKKTVRKRKYNEWRKQYNGAMNQAKWMTLLRMKGVPVPGETRRVD